MRGERGVFGVPGGGALGKRRRRAFHAVSDQATSFQTRLLASAALQPHAIQPRMMKPRVS